MAQVHTHYDNLKVAQNAPIEVIRAAYKTLSQKYHPDKHPGNSDAVRVMTIINTSYDVLCDPAKRREHDQWIAKIESERELKSQSYQATRNSTNNSHSPSFFQKFFLGIFDAIKGMFIWAFRYFIGIGVFAGIIWVISSAVDTFGGRISPPPGPKPYQANPSPIRSEHVRPVAAPNGQVWPKYAGYIKGYQRLHADGLSTVTVDNSQNDSDVFVKLVSLDGAEAYPVRQFYIPAFSKFTLEKITAGSYDIRYRDLDGGGLSRSEAFNIEEIQNYNGVQYSNMIMTLYKVQNGNMQTYGLSEAEF